MKKVFDKYADLPIIWGETDCCQFVGECVADVTGTNPAKQVQYFGKRDAMRLVKEHGSLEAAITSVLGEPVDDYKDGYVGIVNNGISESTGVFFGDRIVCRVRDSIVDFPASRSIRIWKTCPHSSIQ